MRGPEQKKPSAELLHVTAIGAAMIGALALTGATASSALQNKEPVTLEQLTDNNADLTVPRVITTKDMMKKRDDPRCSWVTNFPSGYYMGYACKKDTLVKFEQASAGKYKYDYGAIIHNDQVMCGWVYTGILKTRERRGEEYNYCERKLDVIKKRSVLGKKFNCGPSKCVGAKVTTIPESCKKPRFYRNYVPSGRNPMNAAHSKNDGFKDYIGSDVGTIGWRVIKKHTSKSDGTAVNVVSRKYGWGFMRKECVATNTFGGPKKHRNTIAGPRPNAQRSSS